MLGNEITSLSARRNAALLTFRRDAEEIDELIDNQLQIAIDHTSSDAIVKLEAGLEMEINIDEAFAAIEGYILLYDPTLPLKIKDSEADFTRYLAQYHSTQLSPDEKKVLEVIESDFNEAVKAGNEIVALTNQLNVKLEKFGAKLEKIDQILDDDIQLLIHTETERALKNARQSSRFAVIFIPVIGLFIFVILIYLSWRISKGIIDYTEQLQKGREKYQAVANYTYDWESWIGSDGKLKWVNPVVEKLTGYSVSDCLEMSDYPLAIVHEEDRAEFGELLRQALTEKNQLNEYKFRISHKDGTEYWMAISWQAIYGEEGVYLGLRTSIRDITEFSRTQEILKKQEQQFKFFAMSIGECFWNWEIATRKVEICSRFDRIFGYPKQEICNDLEWWPERIHKKDRKRVWKTYITAAAGKQSTCNYQYRFRHQDGSYSVVEDNICFIRDAAGNVVRSLGVMCNITERKQAERLHELAKFPDENPYPVMRVSSEGVLVFANRSSWRLLKLWNCKVNESIPKKWKKIVKFALDNQKITENTVQCEGLIYSLVVLPFTSSGYVNIYGNDITERMRTEKALQQQIERYELVATGANDAIWDWDVQNHSIYFSQRWKELRGYAPKEVSVLEEEWNSSIHPDDAPGVMAAVQAHFDGKTEIFEEEYRIRHKDGSWIWVLDRGIAQRDAVGNVIRMAGSESDITERVRLRQLESRAVRLETAGTIAGQVAHDFNNLLAPMMAYPEFIRDELPNNHPALIYLDQIEKAAQRIADINQDLLAMGRRGHYNQEVLNLNTIVLHAISELESHTKAMACEIDLSDDLMDILGGNAQLHRMITNLLYNAKDAMHNKGKIAVKTENYYVDDDSIVYGRVPRGEYVKLTISDTGSGIPGDLVQKIFDPFFTSKATDQKRGSGLGLSVVDAVIKDHKGYIDLHSKVGEGTSFYIYLPITREAIESQQLKEHSGGNETILIVDDDDIQSKVTSQLLTKLGYKVSSVESGEKALEYLGENPPDLVILDMIMPGGIDGTDTYQRILDIIPHQKAIIMSGFSDSDRVQEAQKLGAGAFVRKPVTMTIIAAAVRTEFDRKLEIVAT